MGDVSNPLPDTESAPQNVVHTTMLCACNSSITFLLNEDLKHKICDANAMFVQWQDHLKEVVAHMASAQFKKTFKLVALLRSFQDLTLPRTSSEVTKSFSKFVPSMLDTSTSIKHKVSDLVADLYCASLSLLSMPLMSWSVTMMLKLSIILSCLVTLSMNSPVMLVVDSRHRHSCTRLLYHTCKSCSWLKSKCSKLCG